MDQDFPGHDSGSRPGSAHGEGTEEVLPVRAARAIIAIGLAYVFLFFGIDKFIRPLLWIGWIPAWMEGALALTRTQWLSVFGTVEMVLGLLLLIPKPKLQRLALTLMILHLLAAISQAGLFSDIGVRDTGMLLAGISLYFLPPRERGTAGRTP